MTINEISIFINVFLQNRRDFYDTLIPRIPHKILAEQFRDAIVWSKGNITIHPKAGIPELNVQSESIESIVLQEIVKKPGSGHNIGRAVISFEGAIAAAVHIEETGLLFFQDLAATATGLFETIDDVIRQHQQSVTALRVLDDAVRYRKLELNSG